MSSARERDLNGFLLVRDNPITKVGIFPYIGSEIRAPDPDRIYRVYRPQSELEDPETVKSANLIPWIDEHQFLGKDGMPAEEKGVQGTTGESAYFEYPYLRNNIRVYSEYMDSLIDDGKIELSPSYRCEYEFTSGVFDGQEYDAIQRKIRFNHLALVKEGRTGPDVAVQDHSIITIDTAEFMKMEFTTEQISQIRALIEQILAESKPAGSDNADPNKPADEGGGLENNEQVSDQDQPADPNAVSGEQKTAAEETAAAAEGAVELVETAQEAVAEAKEALAEVQEAAKEVEAAPTADSVKRLRTAMAGLKAARAKAAKASDAAILLREVSGLRAQVAKSQDASTIMRQMVETASARDAIAKRVTPFIGAFDSASMLSADDVAKYAVKKLGLTAQDGQEMATLNGFLQAAKPDADLIVGSDHKPARAEDAAAKFWSDKK